MKDSFEKIHRIGLFSLCLFNMKEKGQDPLPFIFNAELLKADHKIISKLILF